MIRRILLTILLTCAICSCRSHKEVQSEAVCVAAVEVDKSENRDSLSKILSLLRSDTDIDISGITIDFFPPFLNQDSMHPDIRAVPKSIHIDKANISNKTNAVKLEEDKVNSNETVNLHADTSSKTTHEAKSENNALSPHDWLLALSIVISIALISVLIYFKFLHKSSS